MMSSSSPQGRRPNRRLNSLQRSERLERTESKARPKIVSYNEAYTYALRTAYLHHLLQPRSKRKQYLTAPKPAARASTVSSIGDLMKDLSGTSKSAKLPHGFMAPLEKRLQGVLIGRERLPGYNDAAVKRTFAEAYTAFTEPGFRRSMDKERRVEDLVLIFYSHATKSLQKGRAPEDESWKGLVDRHVALFVRLLSNTMRDQGNDKDRPELMQRLASLEKKLLTDDQDLTITTGGDSFIEVVVPISYDVKDMPMVQVVAKIFGLKHSQVQSDINANRSLWTEEAALTDLKSYQHCLTTSTSRRTLRSDDFDLEEAYQTWKKAEGPELSQMILDILHVKPDLSKASTSGINKPLPPISPVAGREHAAKPFNLRSPTESKAPFGFDQPVDMSGFNSQEETIVSRLYLEEATYTYIPPDPRAYYRSILGHAMSFDHLNTQQSADDSIVSAPLAKQSLELLGELAARWRIPQPTRLILFLDVTAQKFMDQEFGLQELDTAFEFIKNPPEMKKTGHQGHAVGINSRTASHWTIHDFALYQLSLSNLHDALLRELFEILQHCFESKPPSVGPVILILESHIYGDPAFSKNEQQLEEYKEELERGLQEKAAAVYRGYLEKEVPQNQEEWQFYHVVQLGKAVVKVCQRIQKRYQRSPEIMGVNPLTVLVETMFPSFENDAGDLIQRIIHVASAKNSEVDLEDGFALYKELVEIRRIHRDALPSVPFAFHIEGYLAEFVWRWIRLADSRMVELVDAAIAQDHFTVRAEHPTDDERHSVSVLDIFRLFNETTDQIFKLEWDDDVHHAKFMTALAKSIGVGLSRYCEKLEQHFTAEMDRVIPAQDDDKQQSKQEKWMQLAKDAWSNREKIEPFQFYPESLVKLNNIEFAVQQLDKLEKIINVDACAEVLQRITPVKELQRRPKNYVFTIKIVEGENLKACDQNGFSDPYVVLVDEFQKRLTKTRVIQKNLNPRWDESVDITVQGPVNIVAMIWDSDTFGDDDYVGRTSLKLDPVHFGDYLPKEYWLNLDTQGRLLLRISMEGERDDIQFYFGKSFRLLTRTERDMIRKITDKLSQYINACLSQEALRGLTSRGISIASVTSMWKNRQSVIPALTPLDIENALKPLFTYFDENFAIMKQTLTNDSMVLVMKRLWKEVLLAIERILVPPLSDKPSAQKALNQQELDVVFRWLQLLFDFFNARDEETGDVYGVPSDILKSPKWSELASLNFFYFDSTDNLIHTSERMASATAQRAQLQRNRLTVPGNLGAGMGITGLGVSGLLGLASVRRTKSIMLSRNLGTMRKAKEEKRKEAQAEPSDDMILRILRMRSEPGAAAYLRDRSRQRERLAAAAEADMIVKRSLASGGGKFGSNNLPRR